jgi:hypothetical protein
MGNAPSAVVERPLGVVDPDGGSPVDRGGLQLKQNGAK